MKKHFIYIGATIVSAQIAAADNSTPPNTINDFEQRLNSRFVDELVGEVDFDFTYFKNGTHAYPLSVVKAMQDKGEVQLLADGKTRRLRQIAQDDTSDHLEITIGPQGLTQTVLADKSKERTAQRAVVQSTASATVEILSDSAKAAHATGLPQTSHTNIAYTLPFVRDSTKTYNGKAPQLRFHGDRRGDISTFDLSGVNVETMLQRPPPASLQHIEGLQLGITPAQPTGRILPSITQIEQEYSLEKRRIMRLELRELYMRMQATTYLEIAVENITVNGSSATADIKWHFTDQSEQQSTAILTLEETAEGWQIKQAWTFIEQLASQLHSFKQEHN